MTNHPKLAQYCVGTPLGQFCESRNSMLSQTSRWDEPLKLPFLDQVQEFVVLFHVCFDRSENILISDIVLV